MDSRTPPPGIEVIGELPPGTPWWDAEELGFHWERGRFYRTRVATISFIVILLIVAGQLGFLDWVPFIATESEPDSTDWIASLTLILITVVYLFWALVLTPQIKYLTITGTNVEQLSGYRLGSVMNSIGSARHRDLRRIDLTNCRIEVVRAKDKAPVDWRAATFPSNGIILTGEDVAGKVSEHVIWPAGRSPELPNGLSLIDHVSLLTYRIAKAKGETPPPFALPEDYISSRNGSAG